MHRVSKYGVRAVCQTASVARPFTELLEQAMPKYQNRTIETAQVIEDLIPLARDMLYASVRQVYVSKHLSFRAGGKAVW